MLSIKEIRENSIQDLNELYQNLCKELFVLRNELRLSRTLEKPHQLREKKQWIARILTVLREKQNEGI